MSDNEAQRALHDLADALEREELRPCPFCGDEPYVGPDDPEREGNCLGEVVCENRDCPTFDPAMGHGVLVRDGEPVCDERGSEAYKDAAIRRWNRRAGAD